MKVLGYAGKVFIEIVPGMLSFVATKTAWDALSAHGRLVMIQAVCDRLGQSLPKDTA